MAGYSDSETAVPAAQAALQKDANDADALAVLGTWYAFRGRNDWRASVGSSQVSRLAEPSRSAHQKRLWPAKVAEKLARVRTSLPKAPMDPMAEHGMMAAMTKPLQSSSIREPSLTSLRIPTDDSRHAAGRTELDLDC